MYPETKVAFWFSDKNFDKGEVLEAMCRKYGITVVDIHKANIIITDHVKLVPTMLHSKTSIVQFSEDPPTKPFLHCKPSNSEFYGAQALMDFLFHWNMP